MDFGRLDYSVRVDHKRSPASQPLLVDMHIKSTSELVRWITQQWEPGFAYGRRGFVPHLVREMRIGGDNVNLGFDLLKLWIMLRSVLNLCGAIEGERSRHKNEHRPVAPEAFLGNFNEFAVVKRLGFERLDFSIDQRHFCFLGVVAVAGEAKSEARCDPTFCVRWSPDVTTRTPAWLLLIARYLSLASDI